VYAHNFYLLTYFDDFIEYNSIAFWKWKGCGSQKKEEVGPILKGTMMEGPSWILELVKAPLNG